MGARGRCSGWIESESETFELVDREPLESRASLYPAFIPFFSLYFFIQPTRSRIGGPARRESHPAKRRRNEGERTEEHLHANACKTFLFYDLIDRIAVTARPNVLKSKRRFTAVSICLSFDEHLPLTFIFSVPEIIHSFLSIFTTESKNGL